MGMICEQCRRILKNAPTVGTGCRKVTPCEYCTTDLRRQLAEAKERPGVPCRKCGERYLGAVCGACAIAALEAEVAELKAAVEWMGEHGYELGKNRAGGGYELRDITDTIAVGPTRVDALLAAYRAHIEREAKGAR